MKTIPTSIVFGVLLAIYTIGAHNNNIWDCDESMNYWEPTHYLIHGYGLQTWEYRCGSSYISKLINRQNFAQPRLRLAILPLCGLSRFNWKSHAIRIQ